MMPSKNISAVFAVVLIVFMSSFAGAFLFGKTSCGDGTISGECSSRVPYYCSSGILVENASVCGCPENMSASGNSCVSAYETGPRQITLNYTFDGKKGTINFTVYQGMDNYSAGLSRVITSDGNSTPLRVDFEEKSVSNAEQRNLLLPLVTEIQNLNSNRMDQARIAISLVQNIPFGESNKTYKFFNETLNYSRYPYEVLYDMHGVCEEKSELLAFMLKEMGYGVAFFYNQPENHESVGIKCPVKYSFHGTGYCFVETTGPSVITDSGNQYVNGMKLTSYPQVLVISDGISLGDKIREYRDAKVLEKIRNIIDTKGKINLFRYWRLKSIQKRYGLQF